MKNEKGFIELLVGIGMIVIILVGLTLFLNYIEGKVDKQCKAQFGNEWSGKSNLYSPEMCINSKGDVKYPL